jgi:hypothetical protein
MERLFNLAVNTSGIQQSFFTKKGRRFRAYPESIVDVSQLREGDRGILSPVDSFIGELKKRNLNSFYIERTYNFGDVLLLIPAIRELKRKGYNPILRTRSAYSPILKRLKIDYTMCHSTITPQGFGIVLDNTIERDHEEDRLRDKHRVDLYFNIFGIEDGIVDWSCDLDDFDFFDEFMEKRYCVFQAQGSTPKKMLYDTTARYIIERLNDMGVKVAYIGEEIFIPDNETNHGYFMDLNYVELFSLIGHAEFLITMDSAPLWISHFTKTPLIALLGPSRPSERVTKHPLYPQKAFGLELNKEINCESCFECSKECGDLISCLHINDKRIFELIKKKVDQLWL